MSVDYNGLILFDPEALRRFYPGGIAAGTNLLERYSTTDEGDVVLAAGLFVPVLGIDDGGYTVIVRDADEPSTVEEHVIKTNGVFALSVVERAVVADLSYLLEWDNHIEESSTQLLRWLDTRPGAYAVTVRGYSVIASNPTRLLDAGYEFVIHASPSLPDVTGTTDADMNVQRLPGTPSAQ